MSAKTYKLKVVEPLVKKLKAMVKTLLVKCYEAWDNYYRLNNTNGRLYQDNEYLTKINERLTAENAALKQQNRDYRLLRKALG